MDLSILRAAKGPPYLSATGKRGATPRAFLRHWPAKALAPPQSATGSGQRHHPAPPLRIGSHIEVVLAHEIELAVRAHPEHRQARRHSHHLAAHANGGRRQRS